MADGRKPFDRREVPTLALLHFVEKLNAFAALTDTARQAAVTLADRNHRTCHRGEDLISQGDKPRKVQLIIDGWACRYKILEDGRRQILAIFIPGDLCDLNVYILDRMDHSISAISPLTYVTIEQQEMEQFCDANPQLARALWWESLVSASIQREWLVNAAQRTPMEAIAHLVCELYFRLRVVKLARKGEPIFFPLTQTDIADTLGLTQPHISRLLQMLNKHAKVAWRPRQLIVHDEDSLRHLAGFNPDYLHFRG
jgi:CRP-like cAMP-binding protein